MKTTTKYILASSLVAIIIVAMFGGYFLSQYQDYEVREEQEKLENLRELATVATQYDGLPREQGL